MRRAHYGTGSIQPRGPNSWRLRYRIGGRKFEETVKGSRADAAKALRDKLKAGDDGRHVAPTKLTFEEWAKDWLAIKADKLAGQTIDRYDAILRLYLVPTLGALPLQKIKAGDIDRAYAKLKLAPRTKGLVHVILKACLKTAVKRKLLQSNPVEEAEGVDAEDQDAGTVLDEEELAQLVRGFEGHTLYPIVAFAAYTGARRNEILALRWADINLDRRTVAIKRSVERVRIEDRYVLRIKGPKKARHARTIQIDASLAALLRKEKARFLEWGALAAEALAFPAVGANATTLRSPPAVTTVFHDHCARLGHDLRFHDLRASHETILLDAGVPVHVVAARCGHDPAMLLRVYAKRTKKSDAAAASVIGTLTAGVLWPSCGQEAGEEVPTA